MKNSSPSVHLIQIVVRNPGPDGVTLLLHPNDNWRPSPEAPPYLVLPNDKTVGEPSALFRRGESLETHLAALLEDQLGIPSDEYALEQELPSVEVEMPSLRERITKQFVIYPLDVWISPTRRTLLARQLNGLWLTPGAALQRPDLAPSTRRVIESLIQRESALEATYRDKPADEAREEAPHRLWTNVSDRPSMYALARKWFASNRTGARHLSKANLDAILDSGNRAFNLRVADPYLRYQMQGVGFTWSFFTHKDRQDVHVHGAPVVEIYGVTEGQLEIWWKAYHDRGTSAWNRQILGAGDWIEVDSLQCHYVRWLGEGKGVVFKAGPGPLAEVGKLGVKGKTTCEGCVCMKPPEMGAA